MSTKKEVLEYMKDQVLTHGRIQSLYVSKDISFTDGEQCQYCVLGYGLQKLGFTDEQLSVFTDNLGGSTGISVIMDLNFHEREISLDTEDKKHIAEKIRVKLDELGFTEEELKGLQEANDSRPQEMLVEELNKLIEGEKS